MAWSEVSTNPDLGNTNLYVLPNVVEPIKTVGTAADADLDAKWPTGFETNLYILPGGGGGGGEVIYVPVSADKESWT